MMCEIYISCSSYMKVKQRNEAAAWEDSLHISHWQMTHMEVYKKHQRNTTVCVVITTTIHLKCQAICVAGGGESAASVHQHWAPPARITSSLVWKSVCDIQIIQPSVGVKRKRTTCYYDNHVIIPPPVERKSSNYQQNDILINGSSVCCQS